MKKFRTGSNNFTGRLSSSLKFELICGESFGSDVFNVSTLSPIRRVIIVSVLPLLSRVIRFVS